MKHIIIIPVAITAACEAAAWALGIQEDGKRVLCVDLVPAGGPVDAGVTHVAGMGKLGLTEAETETRRAALEEGFDEGAFPGALWWRMDNDGVLLASHQQEMEPHLGERWDFEAALSTAGLQRRAETTF